VFYSLLKLQLARIVGRWLLLPPSSFLGQLQIKVGDLAAPCISFGGELRMCVLTAIVFAFSVNVNDTDGG
jgi:hypothetical protein